MVNFPNGMGQIPRPNIVSIDVIQISNLDPPRFVGKVSDKPQWLHTFTDFIFSYARASQYLFLGRPSSIMFQLMSANIK